MNKYITGCINELKGWIGVHMDAWIDTVDGWLNEKDR